MSTYEFSLILPLRDLNDEEFMDVAEKLGDADCLDASVMGHVEGVEVAFDREAVSMEEAVQSAFEAICSAGYPVSRLEMGSEYLAELKAG